MSSIRLAVMVLYVGFTACGGHRVFTVIPGQPDYGIRTPAAKVISFPNVVRDFNGFERGNDWMDLRPHMVLHVENAYYAEGAPKQGLTGFLGTEQIAYFLKPGGGLGDRNLKSMNSRPRDQPPVQELVAAQQMQHSYYRFFFAIVLNRGNATRSSVLLGASSQEEMEAQTDRLKNFPESVCTASTVSTCTVFPEACSVAVEMDVTVNGKATTVLLGSKLAQAIGTKNPAHVRVTRDYKGKPLPVKLGSINARVLALPLLPGDQIHWN